MLTNAILRVLRRGVLNAKNVHFSSLVKLEKINLDTNGCFGVIAIQSPKNRNALNKSLVTEFNAALTDLENDTDIRILIIRSLVAGIFSAGADLKERAKMNDSEVSEFVLSLRTLTKRIYDVEVPVIAALDGVALGGGLEIALACDIRTAASNAKLGLVETKLAIIPGAGGTQYLPRMINRAIAKELIFTAKILSGKEAKDLDLVNHVVDQNNNGDAAYLKSLDIATNISCNGPVAIKMAKRAINAGLDDEGLEAGLRIEELCYSRLIPTRDRAEALAAFAEKRNPRFSGQ